MQVVYLITFNLQDKTTDLCSIAKIKGAALAVITISVLRRKWINQNHLT